MVEEMPLPSNKKCVVMDTVVQWNICGFRSNFEELKLLLNRSQSAVVALREFRLGEGQSPPWGYALLLSREWVPLGEAALLLQLSALQAIQRKNFKVKDIRRLFDLIRKFPLSVHISFVWIPAHVGIQGNENVDKLAKAALNKASYSGKFICWSDLKPKVNAYIHTIWQKDWDTEGANKLHEVLSDLGEDLQKRDEAAVPPPWEEHQDTFDVSLTKQKKEDTSKVAYQKEFFRIKKKLSNHHAVYTDGSKLGEKVSWCSSQRGGYLKELGVYGNI
ncbi:ribonuclease hi [Plakobranchus ocellatus]|uniref:Ribonuclease hi n=1 Tax=Plakobranchus ocellatus TaxID=259542 RepID=A0AAV4C3T1_9GAST|nr:ribonuclease hi [Plakobranchus ocellatus]